MSPHLTPFETRPVATNAPANLTPGPHPVTRSGKIHPESVVTNVAVWATFKRTDAKAKALEHQPVDPAARRLGPEPKLSAADVANPPSRCLHRQGPTATPLAEIAEIAEIPKSSMKWASERRRDFSPLIAPIARNTLHERKVPRGLSQNCRNCPNLRKRRRVGISGARNLPKPAQTVLAVPRAASAAFADVVPASGWPSSRRSGICDAEACALDGLGNGGYVGPGRQAQFAALEIERDRRGARARGGTGDGLYAAVAVHAGDLEDEFLSHVI